MCERQFLFLSRKNHDVKISHENVKNYKCDKCDKTFSQKHDKLQHYKLAHIEEERERYKCEYCTKTFKTEFGKQSHINRLHNENHQEFKCDQCSKTFKQKSYMKVHQKHTYAWKGENIPM